MLRLDLCDYSDAYIAMKGTIDTGVVRKNAITQKVAVFKSNSPFRSCISKINNTFIDNAEDLDIVMSIYILLEYIDNFSTTSKS